MCAWPASQPGKWTERAGTISLARLSIPLLPETRSSSSLEGQPGSRPRAACSWWVQQCNACRMAGQAAVERRLGVLRPVVAISHARWCKLGLCCAGTDIGEVTSASSSATMSISPKPEMRLVREAWFLEVVSAAPVLSAAIGLIETLFRWVNR